MTDNGIFVRMSMTREGDEVTRIRGFYFYQTPAQLSAYVQVTDLELNVHEEYIELFEVSGEGLAMDSRGWVFPVAFRFDLVKEDQAGKLRVALALGKLFMMSGEFSIFTEKGFTFLNPDFAPANDDVREHFDRAVQVNYLV